MELVYKNDKVKKQCTSVKEAKKLFGGNTLLATNLLSRINALKSAIIMMPTFHFHALNDKGRKRLKGYFAIDVKTRRDAWRIILRPLDEKKRTIWESRNRSNSGDSRDSRNNGGK